MKRIGKLGSAAGRLAEGFVAGGIVFAVANIGYASVEGGGGSADAPERISFMALARPAR